MKIAHAGSYLVPFHTPKHIITLRKHFMLGLLCASLAASCATNPKKAIIGRPDDNYIDVVFSPDGRTVAAMTTSQKTVVLFDVTNRIETARFTPTNPAKSYLINDMAYTTDGRLIVAVSTSTEVEIWEALSNRRLSSCPAPEPPSFGAFSPDGTRLALTGKNQRPLIWDPINGTNITELKTVSAPIRVLAMSADNRSLATADFERNVRTWDIASGVETGVLPKFEKDVESLSYSPEGTKLTVSASGISVWQNQSGTRTQHFPPPSLSTASRAGGITWSLLLIPMAALSGNPSIYTPAIVSADKAASASVSGKTPTGPASFSPDGKFLATVNLLADFDAALGHRRTQVRIFDIETGELVSTVAHQALAVCAEFSPDGHSVATAGKGVDVWDWKKASVQKGKEYASDGTPFLILLETQFTPTNSAPMAQLPHKHIRLGTFVDERTEAALGTRRAAFGMKMNDLLSAEPVSESLRKAFRSLCLQCGHGVDEEPFDLQVSAVIKKCSVQTPVSLTSWRAEAHIEMELSVATGSNVRLYSKTYTGTGTKNATFTMSRKVIQQACSDALTTLLQMIASDPQWTTI